MARKTTLSGAEKALLIWVSGFVALLAGLALWLCCLDIDPVITLPVPVMPSPNALEYYARAGDAVSSVSVVNHGKRYYYTLDDLEQFSRPDSSAAANSSNQQYVI